MNNWILLTGSAILSSGTTTNSGSTETYSTYVRSGFAVVSKATIGGEETAMATYRKYRVEPAVSLGGLILDA